MKNEFMYFIFTFYFLSVLFRKVFILKVRQTYFDKDTMRIRVGHSRNMPVAPCCLYTNGSWYVISIYGRGGFVPVDPVVGSHENLRESITRCFMLETYSFAHCNGVCNNRIASIFTCMCMCRSHICNARFHLHVWKIVIYPLKRIFFHCIIIMMNYFFSFFS